MKDRHGQFDFLRSLEGPILVTGASGFKGTWLCSLLDYLGMNWVGIGLSPTKNSLAERVRMVADHRFKLLNINDLEKLEKYFEDFSPSAVLHLAAESIVLESYLKPLRFFETNVLGTANILDLCNRTPSIKSVGVVTTDKVYKNENLGRRFVETDPLEGKDPYSSSKVGTESVITAYQNLSTRSNGPRILALRAGNVIGGGDYGENRLIPDLVRHKIGASRLNIRNPLSTRPWQHVLDPLFGYLTAMNWSLKSGKQDNFNFGPLEPSLKVEDVVRTTGRIWPELLLSKDLFQVKTETNIFEEAKNLDLNPTKSNNELSWRPRWDQSEAVIKSIEWWDEVLSQAKTPHEAMKTDIAEFFKSQI